MFSKRQVEQIKSHGLDIKTVEKQMQNFIDGFPYLNLEAPCVPGNGIMQMDQGVQNKYIEKYAENGPHFNIIKFVPASGAATRMFKDLNNFYQKLDFQPDKNTPGLVETNYASVKDFFENIKNFAFYHDLKNKLWEDDKDLEKLIANRQFGSILNTLLFEDGLHYNFLPKALLKFHSYENRSRTPVEEHLDEAAFYCVMEEGMVKIHFTVSLEHRDLFLNHINEVKNRYEEKHKITYTLEYSVQKPSTDMIAVDRDNNPFFDEDNNMVFRPGGHGALLENLNDLDEEIVFIKNIDNVVPDALREDNVTFKKLLGGILIDLKEKIFQFLHRIDNNDITQEELEGIVEFINHYLGVRPSKEFHTFKTEEKLITVHDILNRPLRVCGMVRNQGEPGGGPFWVKQNSGMTSIQIVETTQIDKNNPDQKEILDNSTHFNPVDIVCYLYDYKGNKFNLLRYRDENTGFITIKSRDGKELKAQELPGLWNGAMAHWNTMLVELPLSTFNPVKTVNDLLRKEHQITNKEEK